MSFTKTAWDTFNLSIKNFHINDDVKQQINNPFPKEKVEHLLYLKNWIDTVQWHLEDIIRDPAITPENALKLKRWIDKSNQERTDTVEYIDSWFLTKNKDVEKDVNASINTESPAWAIDRFSILSLKIYHMQEEVNRIDASKEHIAACQVKLDILTEQYQDLSLAIEELITAIETGKKYMKVYKQMKMYNDESLNPVLYANKK
jgi:hypothetical protein